MDLLGMFFSCQDCGSEKSELRQLEDKRIVCRDEALCKAMQALGESNA